MSNITFHKHYVTNGTDKARVRYSYYGITSPYEPKKSITMYEKDYERNLGKVFTNVENDSDSMTDYFEENRVRVYEGEPQFDELLNKLREWKMVSI